MEFVLEVCRVFSIKLLYCWILLYLQWKKNRTSYILFDLLNFLGTTFKLSCFEAFWNLKNWIIFVWFIGSCNVMCYWLFLGFGTMNFYVSCMVLLALLWRNFFYLDFEQVLATNSSFEEKTDFSFHFSWFIYFIKVQGQNPQIFQLNN